MKRIIAVTFILFWIGAIAHAANTTPTGNPGDITINKDGTHFGPMTPRTGLVETTTGGRTYLDATVTGGSPLATTTTPGIISVGAGLAVTTSGVLSATTTGATPAGPTGSPQINNAGTLYGAPVPTSFPGTSTSAANQGTLPPQAEAAITSGIRVDPRGYGAKCTGWYGISAMSIFGAGSGYSVGDKFLVADDNLQNTGFFMQAATGHVTSVGGSGNVTGISLDSKGAGYKSGAMDSITITGSGANLQLNPNTIMNGPGAPTVTLASGGGSSAAPAAGYKHIAGGFYNIGDLFAVPNSVSDGNYLVGRVDSISSTGAISAFHFYNFGGDYAVASGVAAETLTGTGSGATFNVTSSTSAGGTFDDTYGLVKGAVAAILAGGVEVVPDNCWVETLPLMDGAILIGANDAPAYTLRYFWQVGNANPSGYFRAPSLNVIKTPANYAIDLNGSDGGVLRGFRIFGWTGQSFGSSTTWDTTMAIGSSVADPRGTGGNGAGGQSPWVIDRVSAHYFKRAVGTYNSGDPLIFLRLHNNDWGINQAAVYGATSDLIEDGDIMSDVQGYCVEITGGGGPRLTNNRCEFSDGGFKFNGFGALRPIMTGNQITRIDTCDILALNTQQITAVGNIMDGGIAGTLTVTGAAKCAANSDVCLTVSGCGSHNCTSSPTNGLVNGDVCNVSGVTGTTEANGNQITLNVVDGTHIDLTGTSFSNAYVSGGFVGVNQKGAEICLSGTTGFSGTGNLIGGYSSGSELPSAYIIDAVNSTNITVIGNTARKGSGASNLDQYKMTFGNWENATNAPPANTHIDVLLQPYYDNTSYPTVTGLSLTSTGGGLNAAFGLSGTTTAAGTVTLSNLPPNANGYNCIGGDNTIGNSWPMLGATTSTSCGLSATTTSGNSVWFQGKAR